MNKLSIGSNLVCHHLIEDDRKCSEKCSSLKFFRAIKGVIRESKNETLLTERDHSCLFLVIPLTIIH